MLNDSQIQYQKDMINYAKNHLNNESCKNNFSRNIWNEFCEFGWLGLNMPEKFGGLGENNTTCAVVLEAMGYACRNNGFTFVVNNHWWMVQNIINIFGSEYIKNKYLQRLIRGKSIGAFALTEADAGSDSNAIQTSAVMVGEEYILNGSKMFVSNGPIADIYIVFAVTQQLPVKKMTAFVVEREFDGVSASLEIEKMGLDSSPTGELILCNCSVPKENIIGEMNEGSSVMSTAIEYERFYEFVPHIGAMRRVMEGCIEYSKQRSAFGKNISDFQSISHKIADMAVRIEMARALMYDIAHLKDENRSTYVQASMFKLFVSESYVQTCRDALQIYGAYGYTKEYQIEKELRDSLASTIYAGTSEIQRNTIFSFISSFS